MSRTTPATIALDKLGIQFELRVYDHDASGPKTGLQAADVLGEPPHLILKTLMLQVELLSPEQYNELQGLSQQRWDRGATSVNEAQVGEPVAPQRVRRLTARAGQMTTAGINSPA